MGLGEFLLLMLLCPKAATAHFKMEYAQRGSRCGLAGNQAQS